MNARSGTPWTSLGALLALLCGACTKSTAPPPPTGDLSSPSPEEPMVLGPAGTIGLLAGADTRGSVDGVGGAARLNSPMALTVSPDRRTLYIADTQNSTIRSMEVATAAVRTLAGSPGEFGSADGVGAQARFNRPRGLVTDASGGLLYIADSYNYTLRVLELTTGRVRTLAGRAGEAGSSDGPAATARFRQLVGAALDHEGQGLYVSDRENHTIRRVALDTLTVTTVAGSPGVPGSQDGAAGAARLNGPGGLLYLPAGPSGPRLFVADTGNHAVREVTLAGAQVRTFAGSAGRSGSADGVAGAARFTSPHAVASDGNRLFVVGQSPVLREIALDSASVRTLAGATKEPGSQDGAGPMARLGDCHAVAVVEGAVYFLDRLNSNVRRLDPTSAVVRTVAGPRQPLGSRDGKAGEARFAMPRGVAVDEAAKRVYLADTGNRSIRRLDLGSGQVTTLIDASAGLLEPVGLALDLRGRRLFIADQGAHLLRALDLDTLALRAVAGGDEPGAADGPLSDARFDSPSALVMDDAAAMIYVADSGNNLVRSVDLERGVVETVAGAAGAAGHADGSAAAARFRSPMGLALEPRAGVLYVSDLGNRVVRRVALAAGQVTTLAGAPGQSGAQDGVGDAARFRSPGALALSRDGSALYVADSASSAVRRVDVMTGAVSTYVGVLDRGGGLGAARGPIAGARLSAPEAIAVAFSGLLILSDNAVYGVSPQRAP